VTGSYTTQVWDNYTLFCNPAGQPYPTVPLGPAVNLTIISCSNSAQCDDDDACTDDACISGACQNTVNYLEGVECCDPVDGSVEVIDDDNDCTTDGCFPDGTVSHTPKASGTACDTELNTTCTPSHTCGSGGNAGVCLANYAIAGSFCNDQDDCTQSSTCDGAGTCVGSNPLPNGSGCNDGDDCTVGETCLGGVCQGGSDPCPVNRPFCFPDQETTGADCPNGQSDCPSGWTCNSTPLGPKCQLPYFCAQCRQGFASSDCPDDGDCLLMGCVGGTCLENTPSSTVCQDGVFCNGVEFCQEQTPINWTCQPAPPPTNPCSSTPSTPICDEANDRCVECLNSTQCDTDPCLVETCEPVAGLCDDNPLPVNCSGLNGECVIGVCGAGGACEAVPTEAVACNTAADCSYYEPSRYVCILNLCRPNDSNSCDDGEECTDPDTCQNGVCVGTPPGSNSEETVDLVWVPSNQSVDAGESFLIDLYATMNTGSESLLSLDVLLSWDHTKLALVNRFDPCTSGTCPPGQFDWSSSFFPIGGFDADGINDPCTLDTECPAGVSCVNGRCNDGDAYYIAQVGLGQTAPVSAAQPLWITSMQFTALFPTGLSGTDVAVSSCIVTTFTRVIRSGVVEVQGDLGTATVVTGCLVHADCDDGDACTNDVCQANGTCTNTPNYTVGVQCCNPANGSVVTISDGNACTNDVCNATTGAVTHPQVPNGTACGSGVNTDCDNPDSCQGGVCQSNFEAPGFACNDEGNACTNNVCNGAGTCTHPNWPAGTACGDGSTTQCTNPDSCNGSGICLGNHVASGTACADEGNQCTDDVCNGLGTCTHPNRIVGTPCGDPGNTDCTNPDTCSGTGTCLSNHEAAGFACGDTSNTACDNPDGCNGSGVCLPNREPAGTNCDNGIFCDGSDACDGLGACLSSGPPCDTCSCTVPADCDIGDCVGGICIDVTECPCSPPIVASAGSRYLAVTPLPADSGVAMRILVSSPDFPCLSKFVAGPLRCGGTGERCSSIANCNECSISGDPCTIATQAEDCVIQGDTCIESGLDCIPGAVEGFDVNGDAIPDGTLATLVDDPADAAALTPAAWGSALNRCSRSFGVCFVDDNCDHGVCVDALCAPDECDTPCSVAAQGCSRYCSVSQSSCVTSANCPAGQTCIVPTCVRDEVCAPGRVYIAGRDIVPSTKSGPTVIPVTYDVEIDCGGFTAPVSIEMKLWADVNDDLSANFNDMQMVVLAFQGNYIRGNGVPSNLAGIDIVGTIPCVTDQVPNFTDIQAMVFTFQGQNYVGRLHAGTCANATNCDVVLQNCNDATTCVRGNDCELPCSP